MNLKFLGKKSIKNNIAYMGATPFNQIGTTPEMLIAANESCEAAKQLGPNESIIRDENDLARDMLSWKDLIFDIIENSKFEVGYIGDAKILNGAKINTLVMQEAFTNAKDKNNIQIPIGTFVSIAEKYNKIIDFDKAVVNQVINHIKYNKIAHDISINLSLDSISDSLFIDWITRTLKENTSIFFPAYFFNYCLWSSKRY